MIEQQLVEMGVSLTELALKGTASAVTKKIKAVKDLKDTEKLRVTYDELINEVLQEREEAVRIAQAYKSELDRIVISDEDIKHLNTTITQLLEIIKSFSPNMDVQSIETLKNLITVDTLKTMQLIGFNYKAAIGEPLTEICANKILSWGNKNKNNIPKQKNK